MFNIEIPRKYVKILITIVITAVIVAASYLKVFETFELATLDLRFKYRPLPKTTDKVVLIDIARDTLDAIGEWPIDRAFYTELINALTSYGAEAIIFDMIFSSPTESDDGLEEAIKKSGRVYIGSAFRLSGKKGSEFFPSAIGYESRTMGRFEKASRKIGHINMIPDMDGKRRRVPLLIDFKGQLVPQLSFAAVLDHIGDRSIKLVKSRYIKIDPDFIIPIDSNGETIVNFAGRWGEAFKHYSFIDVLKSYAASLKGKTGFLDLNEFRGKLCLVGLTAAGTHDVDAIPLQESYPMVGLHANLINTILTRSFIIHARPLINILILLLLSLSVILVVVNFKPLISTISTIGIFFGFILSAFAAFGFFNLWIDLFYPLFIMLAVYISGTFYKYITERQKRFLMEKELEIAKRIQRSFLKEAPPKREGLDIGVKMTPAKAVGGDLYDFVEIKDGGVGIMIGDVSGKGVPAALFMARTVSDFQFHAKTEAEPLKVVTELNNQISTESTSGLFVTASYLVVDTASKKMAIVDAGHLPVVHAGKDVETSYIKAEGGMAIGIMDGVEFTKNEVFVKADDVFVLYTDGVTEARNIKKEEFGEDRLKEAVSRAKDSGAADITEAIYKELRKFIGKAPQHDDITIISIKIK